MKTNINSDNYEAYLLDYLEGNLSPDETQQLKAYVAAQGLNWEKLTEPLPHLKAPQIAYQNKDRLRPRVLSQRTLSKVEGPKDRNHDHKSPIVPLYAKITSVAAAAGLLLAVWLWPEKSMPKTEPVAELTPIEALVRVDETSPRLVLRRTVQMAATPSIKSDYGNKLSISEQPSLSKRRNSIEKNEMEAIAILSPLKPQSVSTPDAADVLLASDFSLLHYRMEVYQDYSYLPNALSYEKEMPTSFIEKGIYWMTEGRHSNLGDLINAGLHLAKKEVVKATTDAALTAYYRADEHLDDLKEHWQEKLGE